MNSKFKDRWFWCELCNSPSIQCEHCKNTSCNGGGCDLCYDDFKEVIQMIGDKTAPSKEGLPIRNNNIWITEVE